MNLCDKYELEKILDNKSINTVFQPIVSLKDASIIGYEALSRGPKNSPLHSPEKLFSAAECFGRIWELELLCRLKAIEKANIIDKNKFLFINVDPKIFKDERFRSGFTKDFLKDNNMCPDSIIFEITEKTAIEDYKSFKTALDNYVNQGYKIAIDDMGTGYSGLKTLMETKPHYIKIDISFIKDIDKDAFKQELVKTFLSFANSTNMKVIAEGIETESELLKLISIGITAGQGYFLQRPSGTFLDISESVKEKIIKYNKIENNKFDKNYVGNIVQRNPAFPLSATGRDMKKFFDSSGVTGACIEKNGYPVGLIMQHNLDYVLATQYGLSVFLRRPVSLIMDCSPLIVDYYTDISDVSRVAMERDPKKIYDYVIVTKKNKYYGIVTIKNLLEYTIEFEKNHAKNLNPLTGLPGNEIINKTIDNMINCNSNFFLIYADLNNFKTYNDTYGFENGDKVLKFTARLIEEQIKKFCIYNSFVGHIGGDDFVCIIENQGEICHELCKNIISEFDLKILDFFNEKDKNNGYIESFDRKGNKDIFPLTSIALGCMYGNFSRFKDIDEIGVYMSKIKKKAKKNKNSSYVVLNINHDSLCYN
ncbi:MAG: GGDEF domain-containing protein [Clostridium sp.]|jgi:EAL domain-containing protein (putative c-di-GMP-specific phosphodiesterase class I)/GGDEF domain-containing protein|uniref:GGDEF domain-containing protein n=1 Tax=Clostridium sp. TaxID=1506 RepID=UPI0025BAE4DD|nr:GGDEF domain-containing protein [Clostridium sp.]MCH3964071.1 GGDEF domain-containing protein [Clostridium sp.]MCI1716272.1 GGDEF domain-containing protein [Clostridium sp.]MCI1800488.1 GGDEF domain-containing protein [Clostridium sp.]MCI1814449.1 GGDEF domain-containing protein [Clostridium sp.]MCI1871348.1 GGDEF domain-containing protein [Clostridium sp.]